MPRPKRLRKIVAPPKFDEYKPIGNNLKEQSAVELLYEEYEAIKLADYDFMHHKDAAELMGISRATFARIYEFARRKIAKALVESRSLKTVYGNAWMESGWWLCAQCSTKFTLPITLNDKDCPMCSSTQIKEINE